jgi:hypothetical protein
MANPGQYPVERRLAAILTADAAGYRRPMGSDEAGLARVASRTSDRRRSDNGQLYRSDLEDDGRRPA